MLEVGKAELAGQATARWPLQKRFWPVLGVNTSFEGGAI
jgi:hypothetical protein